MNVVSKGVTLYTAGTPNGWKMSVLLKELSYPHTIKPLSMQKAEMKEDWFLKINPNGRIPAIVDHDNDDYPVFESGACMMYVCEKAGKLYPQEFNKRHEVNQWLFFMNAGVGPMQGQANHFFFQSEKLKYPINRYVNETKRLYSVLDTRLKDNEWLAAGEYTIADIATFCWVACCPAVGINLDDFPGLKRWYEKIRSRPAVKEGVAVPERSTWSDMVVDDALRSDKLSTSLETIAAVNKE